MSSYPVLLFLKNRNFRILLPCLVAFSILLFNIPVQEVPVPFRFDVSNSALVVVALIPSLVIPYFSASPMPALEAASDGRIGRALVCSLFLLHHLLWAAAPLILRVDQSLPTGMAEQLMRNVFLGVSIGYIAMIWLPREIAWSPGAILLCVTWMLGTTGPYAEARIWSIPNYPAQSFTGWLVTALLFLSAFGSLAFARRTWGRLDLLQ